MIGHAAALALVGWYLMVPPTGCSGRPNPKAPLSQWTVIDRSETEGECYDMRKSLKDPTADRNNLRSYLDDAGYSGPLSAVGNAQCFATDDPRLKGN